MKDRFIKFFNLLVCFILVFFAFTYTYGWFVDGSKHDVNINGSSSSYYFFDGNGTEEDPYVIENYIHIYYLSWLHIRGFFEDEANTYFVISDGTKTDGQYNSTTINMAGALNGGAIPPIGSKDNPFLGKIDGCGSVIKNLWVSTNPSDWIVSPNNPPLYDSTHVGLFGSIAGTAEVNNIILDRIEITSHLEDTVVGIISGYVDAKLTNVKVFNGIITSDNISKYSTRYTLVGDISQNVKWSDLPLIDSALGGGEIGGGTDNNLVKGTDLVVDPNGDSNFSPPAAGGYYTVPDSQFGTAYYAGAMGFKASNPYKNAVYIISTNGNNTTSTKVTQSYINSITNPKVKERLQDVYDVTTGTGSKNIITLTQAPFTASGSINSTVTVKNEDNEDIKIPGSGLWFRPKNSGTAALAFVMTSMNSNRYYMIYKIKRIDKNTVEIVDTTEFTFKKGSVQNGSAVYHELEITTDDVANKYEFVIGLSNVSGHLSSDVGLMYMRLAGSDHNMGVGSGTTNPSIPGTEKFIDGIDFITKDELDTGIISREGVHQTLLRFNYDTSTKISIKTYYTAYLMAGESKSKVYYYSNPNTIQVLIVDFSRSKQSGIGFPDYYYIRETESNNLYSPLSNLSK